MAMQSLWENVKVTRVSNAVAAGTTAINSSVIDMSGFEGVMFMAALGAIVAGAVTSLKAQQGTDATVTDAADLAGSAITIADTDDNKVVLLQLYRPAERYVRVVLSRATQNATLDSIVAVQYGGRRSPTTHDATTVLTGESSASPAEGTA